MLREGLGLTQSELAERAGVSRQLVGALESGRHLPRVDAAIGIAASLGVGVESLFAAETQPVDVVTGESPGEGAAVRVATVGDRVVVADARIGTAGWDVADAVIETGTMRRLTQASPGVVVAGCEPGLEVLERLLRESGVGALSVACSSAAALRALDGGRAHAAVVHARHGALPNPPPAVAVTRLRLCSWRVGLAAPADARPGWVGSALSGTVEVVQRESGAAVQGAFERAMSDVSAVADAPGPRVGSHLEAARLAGSTGRAAVTIEPAAIAVGAAFHPLETHESQLWVVTDRLREPAVQTALNEISGARFLGRLEAIGGYDLDGCGVTAA